MIRDIPQSLATRLGITVILAVLVGCNRADRMPDYPYDVPRAVEKEVFEVDLVGAVTGHLIDARLPTDNARLKIHVADILAPVKGQPWNSESVAALDALVKGKRAKVHLFETLDVADEVIVIGRVYVEGHDVSWELVGSGNAWVWMEKSNDQALMKLQDWARRQKKGLWALPESEREPPWDFMDRHLRVRERQREEAVRAGE